MKLSIAIIKTVKIKVTKTIIGIIKINTKVIANNYLIVNRVFIIKNNNKTVINKYIEIIENKSQLLFKFLKYGTWIWNLSLSPLSK